MDTLIKLSDQELTNINGGESGWYWLMYVISRILEPADGVDPHDASYGGSYTDSIGRGSNI
ncbi:MAG: hypothetical protein LBS01_08305 [Prevotellaceae bacterium]|jgi:hypothetical protein|nr:hypothetical protein [Prevotellaceae bacterium]